jgi:hypothetical protein
VFDQVSKTLIEGRVFVRRPDDDRLSIDGQRVPVRLEAQGSVIRFDLDVPGRNAGISEIECRVEFGACAGRKGYVRGDRRIAIGREKRSAALTKIGSGMILVRIEMALIPASNTPKPPDCQIQSWPA